MSATSASTPSAAPGTSAFAAVGIWLPCDQAHFFHHEGHSGFRKAVPLTAATLADEPNKLNDQVYHRLLVVLAAKGFSHAIPVYHSERPFGDDPDAGVFVNMRFRERRIEWEDEFDQPRSHQLPDPISVDGLALLVNSSGFTLLLARYAVDTEKLEAMNASRKARREEAIVPPEETEAFLQDYLYTLVGGNFASRYSGWPDDAPMAIDRYEQSHTLKEFTEARRSVLIFDQVNTIFEGLYSSALDPRIFFYDNSDENEQAIARAKRGYSLGAFVRLIAAPVTRADYEHYTPPDNKWDGDRQIVDEVEVPEVAAFLRELYKLHPCPSHKREPTTQKMRAEAHYLCHDFLGERACGVILRKFLQASAASSLEPYKLRVERCRRALVQEILEVTQHQDPLLQVEVPDDEHDRIPEVNEAQLRGYALLCSAKLPLLNNVKLYLTEIGQENAWFGTSDEEIDGDAVVANTDLGEREIKAALAMWSTLYTALENDVRGLEIAIAQERQDMLVREEMKVRVEQETLAEIERLQQRDAKSLSPRTTLTINVLANLFALASVAVAIFAVFSQQLRNVGNGSNTSTQASTPGAIPSVSPRATPRATPFVTPGPTPAVTPSPAPTPSGGSNPIPVSTFVHTLTGSLGALLLFAFLLVVIYFVAQLGASITLRVVISVLRRARIYWGERFYYEMDLHLEAPLDSTAAANLLDGLLPRKVRQKMAQVVGARRMLPQQVAREGLAFWRALGTWLNPITWPNRIRSWRRLTDFERNSYRVERITSTEAMHKLYVEFGLRLPMIHWYRWPWRVPLVLVYEFYFHQTARTPGYILQDVRVISTNGKLLTQKQLNFIKAVVAETFVNPLIPRDEGPWTIRTKAQGDRPADALMSLTERDTPQLLPRNAAWRLLNSWAHAVRFIGVMAGLIYVVRASVMALVYGASHRGEHVLFEGDTIVHAAGIDKILGFATEHPLWMLLPLAVVALAGVVGYVNFRLQWARKQAQERRDAAELPAAAAARAAKAEAETAALNATAAAKAVSIAEAVPNANARAQQAADDAALATPRSADAAQAARLAEAVALAAADAARAAATRAAQDSASDAAVEEARVLARQAETAAQDAQKAAEQAAQLAGPEAAARAASTAAKEAKDEAAALTERPLAGWRFLFGAMGFSTLQFLRVFRLLFAIALGTAGVMAFIPSLGDFVQWFLVTVWTR